MFRMKLGIKVGDIMTRDFISVNPDANIQDCARIMIKKRVGSLVVQEKGILKGLLTERDIIWAMTKKPIEDLKEIKAKDIAKKKILTVKPSADLYEALCKMRKSKYRWLPVVVKKRVLGFLTIKDIIRIEPSLFEIVHSQGAFQIREEQEKLRRREIRKGFREGYTGGVCEECGNYNLLQKIDGRLICESCRDNM